MSLIHRFVRRVTALLLAAGTAVLGAVILATPAHADVPVGWNPSPEPVNAVHAAFVVAIIPFAIFLVLLALVYGPSLARGEDVTPGGPAPLPDQWIGGPRTGTKELAGPDGDESKAGGARGTW